MNIKLREKKIKNGNISLYLDFYDKGKRNFEFLGIHLTGDKKQDKNLRELASSIRAKRELEAKNNEFGFTTKYKIESNFIEYFKKIMNTKQANIGTYKSTLFHLNNFVNDNSLKFSEITPSWLETFKAYLLVQVAPSTARGLFACINLVLNNAVKDEIIPSNPFQKVGNIKGHNTQRAYLTFDELTKLSETSCGDSEVKRAFLFSCYCGLRIGDIKNLKWNNIQNDNIVITQGKTKEPLLIPISNTAKQLIGLPDSQENSIFKIPGNTQLSLIMKTWILQSGINKRITFHSARHTFATLALTFGADIYTVSKLLGHSRLETTLVYAKIIDKKKNDAINMLPEIKL